MSDLIERLRDDNSDAPYTDRHLAADRIAELEAENARLKADRDVTLDALFDAIALIGHVVPMNTTALVGGEKLTALNVWQAGYDLMFPKRQARAALKEIEGD